MSGDMPFSRAWCLCLLGAAQDSDRFWRVTPPARRSIQRMLNSSAATLALSWEILRSAPLATKKGIQEVPLSAATSQGILHVLQVTPYPATCCSLQPDCNSCGSTPVAVFSSWLVHLILCFGILRWSKHLCRSKLFFSLTLVVKVSP